MPTQNSDTFAITLPSDLEIKMTRLFNAPRELVFAAWTQPEHLRHWYGCDQMNLDVCEIDLRPGGAWRYVMTGPDGITFPFKGVYREVAPPDRLVHTQIFDVEPWSVHETIVTVNFTEQDGKTLMTETILHQSVEGRNAHLQSGMESGVATSFNRLEEHMAMLASPATA